MYGEKFIEKKIDVIWGKSECGIKVITKLERELKRLGEKK